MSFWNKVIGSFGTNGKDSADTQSGKTVRNSSLYAFVDVEVGLSDHKIHDIGAVRYDGATFHSPQKRDLLHFLKNIHFLCGHNIINHDAKYLFNDTKNQWSLVDTLYISPLLFPNRPYHRLLKDDKLLNEQLNNPVNDCKKALDLFMDEVNAWKSLPSGRQDILSALLMDKREFSGFLSIVGAKGYHGNLTDLIKEEYRGRICTNANIELLISNYPVEMAYALSLINTTDYRSTTPAWVLHNYPQVETVVRLLRHKRCFDGCEYCNSFLDVHQNLKTFFGYSQFRTYEGEPLQENAAKAAVEGKSLLAIFPTGGGKSLTFQLPALMEGRTVHGLTVIISPLQSLMKDQVDNLADKGIVDAVTINGLMDPITRSLAIQRVQNGDASLLYIAPEMLRSNTIKRVLMARHVVRFVIDEAHCFSSWGHDFRVDYLYIGKFISQYQKEKHLTEAIPVSCFTATAKQKVIQDICDYFKQTLGINMELFASSASRTNLRYSVIHTDTDEDKYLKLRSLIAEANCPTIIYVSRTKRTKQLADKLTRDGFKALPFNGKMNAEDKIANQDDFMTNKVSIIVATSAFGMGVDKSDVGLVVHYDISDSLENYVQEAGRAGRDPNLEAKCFVLYGDSDLDKHFILLNQTKLSISEIQQVWKAVKEMTKQRARACCSALEIARAAGWDDSVSDIETRVRTALSALEQGGYIERGNNIPHVYATGITVKNMDEARRRITESLLFENEEVEKAVKIIKSLISQKHIVKTQNEDAESRIDYLADILGLTKREVVSAVERMRQEGILADSKDISAYLRDVGDTDRKPKQLLDRFAGLERYLLQQISNEPLCISSKQLTDNAQNNGIKTAKEKDIRTLLYFLTIKEYMSKKEDSNHNLELTYKNNRETILSRFEKRLGICYFTIEWLYRLFADMSADQKASNIIQFSVVELLKNIQTNNQSLFGNMNIQLEDVEEALLYLSKIGALKLEGGFLVLYNAMDIRRIKDSKLRYKIDDYRMLNEFYKQKIQQVHIVGEYANLMVKDYNAALQYVRDYFQMDYKRFVAKYFKGERVKEIERNISPQKYKQLFAELSTKQMEIISDKESRCIVVAAGPGSGKTRVLVHKLASLLLLEDVKHEQLLMLTFSRAAATEFKQRLMTLIGNAAHFVEIKTFHSYCFELLGKIGNIDDIKGVVAKAAKMIEEGEVEPNRIGKTVLVIDEAQDMSSEEYALVSALMKANEEMRVIAVGDDDQNIYEFRGSNSRYMKQLLLDTNGKFVEMTENYRSSKNIVAFANAFTTKISMRMKSTAIRSMSSANGVVRVSHYTSQCLYQPVVEDVLKSRGDSSVCVLTQKNEEAVILLAMFRKYGLKSKLIQSMDGFRFWKMAEVRFFLKQIDKLTNTPSVTESLWEQAKTKTFDIYSTSTSLPYLKRCIELYEQTNNTRYINDFKEFVYESSVEDYCDVAGADIVISTIHKSKGREFDNVYMLIADVHNVNDEQLRKYYVGMTRAKKQLSIHTDSSVFDRLPADTHLVIDKKFDFPSEIVLQLSHKDVNLDFFKSRKSDLLALRAGNRLQYTNYYLYEVATGRPVAKLSQKMQNELTTWESKGYYVSDAFIRFIVSWKPQNAPKEEPEYAVLLPDLKLIRQC